MAKKRGQKNRRGGVVKDEGPPPFFNYWMTQEYESHFKGTRLAPWEDYAGAFAERIRRGQWDAIDRGAFVDLLQELSVAIRSRYDAPSAAAKAALDRIFDALSCSGPGRLYGFEGLKFDRLYRRGREALLAEWLVYVEAKKEAAKLSRADEEFSTPQFLKKRLGADRLSAIERLMRGLTPATTKREMKRVLGLNTRDKPPRRMPKSLR